MAAIIRWMERCKEAWRSGSPESALMDVECARSDLDRLSSDLWDFVKKEHTPQPGRKTVWLRMTAASCKAAFLALAVVLTAASPLARSHRDGGTEPPPREETALLEWVTPDEKALLGNLRKRLSEGNTFTALPDRRETSEIPVARQTPRSPRAETKQEETNKRSIAANDDKNVPYDRIIALIKTGEKALKNELPAIAVDRR